MNIKRTIWNWYIASRILILQGHTTASDHQIKRIYLHFGCLCHPFNNLKLQPFWSQLMVYSTSTEAKTDCLYIFYSRTLLTRSSLGGTGCTDCDYLTCLSSLSPTSKRKGQQRVWGSSGLRDKSFLCTPNTFCSRLWSRRKTSYLCQKHSYILVNCFITVAPLDLWSYK